MGKVKDLLRVVEAKEPKGIKSVWDSGDKTVDQYTIIFDDSWSGYDQHKKSGAVAKDLFMSLVVDADGGRRFSQFSDAKEGKHLGNKIKFKDLPMATQKHVIQRSEEE